MVWLVVLLVAGVSVVLSSVVLVLVVGRSLAQPAKVRSDIPKTKGINFFIKRGVRLDGSRRTYCRTGGLLGRRGCGGLLGLIDRRSG